MISEIGTLLCWNRAPSVAALFWNETARHARVVLVDELGPACRIAIRPPSGVRMTSLPPSDLTFLQHDHRADVLADALPRVLGGARSLRVLTVDSVDDPALLQAATRSFRPEIVDIPPEPWRLEFEERARRRHGTTMRLRIDDLAIFDLPPLAADAPVPTAIIRAGRQATLLLPGPGGGATRIVLHLRSGEATPELPNMRLTVDDADALVTARGPRIEAIAHHLQPSACHFLRIGHDAPGRCLAIVGVEIGPVS